MTSLGGISAKADSTPLGGVNSPALRARARACNLDILEAYQLLANADAIEVSMQDAPLREPKPWLSFEELDRRYSN